MRQKRVPADQSAGKYSLLSLAVPILIEQVLRSLMGTVNTSILGHYSTNAVSSVGVANQIMNITTVLFNIATAGAVVLLNQTLGSGERRRAGHIAMNALSISVLLGAAVSLILAFGANMFMGWVGLGDDLRTDAAVYLRIVGSCAVVSSVSAMCSGVFRSYGRAKLPMVVVLFNNLINFAGTYTVVYRPIELPLYGVRGVAIVRVLSEGFGMIVLLLMLFLFKFGFAWRDMFRLRLVFLKKIAGVGMMSGVEGISYTLGQVVTTSFITALGAMAISTKTYVQNIDFYAYVMGQSIGNATQIISGHLIGAGKSDEAFRVVNRNWRYVAICNVTFGTLMYLFSPWVMRIFTTDPEIIAHSRVLFLIDIAIHAGRSFNHTHNAGLRSAGYVFVPMLVAMFSIWLCNVGLGYVFSTTLGLGVAGLWLGQMTDEWVRGITTMTLWQKKFWQKKRLIDS
ncbi:MAG: MATE family efflux transporter [Clostridia bacterium]|nr:MATE family efflux transporter [Clostridia bacterium]